MAHRDANGPFRSRKALKDVARLGPKAYEQCAGFLRIRGGDDPLDASSVHPEAYPVVRRDGEAARAARSRALIGNTAVLRVAAGRSDFVDETFGLPTVTDILKELEKPGRDPRPAFKTATFKEGVEKIGDLAPGMVLEGVVTNVAAFGAFVDVGVHQDGLVHVSAMSKTFVKDPRDVVKPGDIVQGEGAGRRHPAQADLADAAAGRRGRRPAGGRRPRSGERGRQRRPLGTAAAAARAAQQRRGSGGRAAAAGRPAWRQAAAVAAPGQQRDGGCAAAGRAAGPEAAALTAAGASAPPACPPPRGSPTDAPTRTPA